MARLDVNRSAEMEVYVAVVEQGGFQLLRAHFP